MRRAKVTYGYTSRKNLKLEKRMLAEQEVLCYRYTCFLHYFALFEGLGLNR